MKISTKGRYALRMMLDIAGQGEGAVVSLKEISQRQDISVKYQEQIVMQLSRAGFLTSVRGPSGGYRLSRHPKDYRIGEILRAIEGRGKQSLRKVHGLSDASFLAGAGYRYQRICGSVYSFRFDGTSKRVLCFFS